MTKPFQIIVHNDLDGGASAIVIINHIWAKYGKDAEYSVVFKTYKNVNQYVERVLDHPEDYEKIFIADISVEEWLAEQFTDNVMLLDHHDTADVLKKFDKCIVDTTGKHSGASLCFKTLILDEGFEYTQDLKRMVSVAHDYDLWIHKLPNKIAKNLNHIYYLYWGEKFIERFVHGFDKFNDEEKEFLKTKWQTVADQIRDGEFIDLMEGSDSNKLCLFINGDEYRRTGDVNEVCEHALTELGYEVIICATPFKSNLSVRATEHAENRGLHVGEVNQWLFESGFAENGGGHARAGGSCYGTDDNLEKFIDTYSEKILEYGI